MGFCIVLTTIVNSFTNVSLSYYSKKADVKFNLLRVLGQNEMQPDIRVTGHFTVEEALYGCSKTVEYARQVISVNPMITVVGVDGRGGGDISSVSWQCVRYVMGPSTYSKGKSNITAAAIKPKMSLLAVRHIRAITVIRRAPYL
jgi:hypothetical protein